VRKVWNELSETSSRLFLLSLSGTVVALSSFASGALLATTMAAVLTWLAVSWQQHVDVRVERPTAVVRAASTSSLSQQQVQSGTEGTNVDAKIEDSATVGAGK